MISIDAVWFVTELMDMHAGRDTALARVAALFDAAKPQCAHLFANCPYRLSHRMVVREYVRHTFAKPKKNLALRE